jgi:hypothetical protein
MGQRIAQEGHFAALPGGAIVLTFPNPLHHYRANLLGYFHGGL